MWAGNTGRIRYPSAAMAGDAGVRCRLEPDSVGYACESIFLFRYADSGIAGTSACHNGTRRVGPASGIFCGVARDVWSGVALGSWFSVVPVVLMPPARFVRTVQEDRFLKQNLPGYLDYSAKVRYRCCQEFGKSRSLIRTAN